MSEESAEEIARRNIALVHRWAGVTDDWDTEGMHDIFDPGVTVEFPWCLGPYPRVIHGKTENDKFVKAWAEFAPVGHKIYDLEVHAFIDDPNELYISFTSFMTLKNGEDYTNEYLARMTVRDGKVVHFKEWPEPIRLLKAMHGSINEPTFQPDYDPEA